MADIRQKAAENKAIQAFCAKYNKITSYINFPTESSKYSFIVFMIAALAAFFISVNARYDQFDVWKQNKEQFFYENTPMMTTLDAYKYTRHAKELNAGEYVPGGDDIDIFYPEGVPFYDPAPLLSVILAKIHNITGADYYSAAINMVPWLGSIFILAVCLYFYFAGYPALGIITGLLTTFAPVFYGRTSIGRFDTDGGNMFFLFLASIFVLTASKAKKETSLYILSACLGLTMLAFQHFYNHVLFNLVYFVVFAVSVFIYNHKYKNILIALLIYILTSNPLVFINSLGALIGSMAVYIPFLPNNLEANSPIPWVYNTISEAAAESFDGIVNFTIQNSLLFILGLIGGILFFIANIKKALPLAPIFAMGFVTFISSGRFAMFLMPVIAAGFGYLMYITSHYIFRTLSMQYKNRSIYINTFAPLLLTIMLLSGIFAAKLTAYGMIPGPSIDTSIYALIDKMGKELPDNSTVYTWWDYGLAITDITGFPVYHSGMSQSTPKTWMIAKSLTGSQEELYNISSYIAKGGYEEVQKMFKDNKTIDEVSNVMTSYNKGPENENIYILFTFDMIQKYSAISYLAGNTEAILTTFCQPGDNNTLLCSNNININVETGILSANSNNIQLSRLMLTDNGKLTNTQTYTLQTGYSVVLMPAANGFITYILSPSLLNSSFVQLFLLQNADEKYFTPVINQYPYGVVYKVKPKDF